MTDIFFSYKSNDRERVRPARDAFAALGFEVFWDQEVPAGVDWDSWIRRHLAQAKCAVVFWSLTSVLSDNVRHEATIAKQQNKLIPVLLDPLTVEHFPMGLYAQQAANLIDWKGNLQSPEWRKLRGEIEAKLTPAWVRDRIDELEAELVAERARREAAERRDKIWQAQIAKEVQGQEDLKRERDKATEEAAALGLTVQELSRALSQSKEQIRDLSGRLENAENRLHASERGRNDTTARAVQAERKLRDLEEARRALFTNSRSVALVNRSGARVDAVYTVSAAKSLRTKLHETWARHGSAISLVAVVAVIVIGFWMYQRWLGLDASSGSVSEGDRKPTVARAAEQRPTPTPTPTPTPITIPRATGDTKPVIGAFTISQGMEANGTITGAPFYTASIADCEDRCGMAGCGVFSYSKISKKCYLYRTATLSRNEYFDSGTFAQAADQRAQPTPGTESNTKAATGAFAIAQGMEANGTFVDMSNVPTVKACQDRCAKNSACGVFTYSKLFGYCYLYQTANLRPNDKYDSGIRK